MDFKSDLNKTEEKYRQKVQALIASCPNCEHYDHEDGRIIWLTGSESDVQDLFFTCNVPEKYMDNIAEHLCCPNCGSDGFDQYSDIGVKSRFDLEVEAHMAKVYRLYGNNVQALEKLLEKYPLLAYMDKFAKRIYKEIQDRKLPVTSIKGNFFRARLVESSEVVSSRKMYRPPLGKPSEGRFNHAGQSHLYLANDKLTAIKEVVADQKAKLVWYQKFEITKVVEDILDLSFDWENLTPSTSALLLSLKVYNTLGRRDRNKENWKPDYYLTRYIMDCAKSLGYRGIKYNSAKSSHSYDVVLFYPNKIKIRVDGDPSIEIFLNKSEKDIFSSIDIDF